MVWRARVPSYENVRGVSRHESKRVDSSESRVGSI